MKPIVVIPITAAIPMICFIVVSSRLLIGHSFGLMSSSSPRRVGSESGIPLYP